MQKRWVLREADESVVSLLSEQLKIPPLVARILALRGLNDLDSARRYLSSSLRSDLPSPFLIAGMEQAAGRLVRALERKELICVWGDYDVDGTTGTAVLVSFLREVGGEVIYYIPHRIDEGYGLNPEGLKQLSSQGVRLVVSVDCGISNYEEVELARSMGIDVVIVDHHELPPNLPPAFAITNPHRPDCSFPDKGLSGAGLAFYLIIGLRAKLREAGWFGASESPDIRRYLDIVTLGTIADMVPLTGVNRVLARRGLTELGGSTRPGVVALKQVARLPPGEISAGQVGFQLGPRINAAGRMDAGLKVVEMLTTESQEVALRIAQELDEHNRERQAMEAQVLAEALSQVDADPLLKERYSIVLGREGWHPGVLGIVASRIVERFHRPTVVIAFSQGAGKGSARSIRGFHMVEGLRCCADFLEKFGGHEYAGGLSIKQEKFPSFLTRFEEIARNSLAAEDLIPVLEVDAELEFSEIGLSLIRHIETLKPFGIGNPEPLFVTKAVEVSERRDFSGGSRLRLRQGGKSLGAVVFGLEKDFPASPGANIDLVYRLTENEWNGSSAVELRIIDCRLAP
ncbi:MAG: single-stranded-DNA-specific exonuclease RecJ [Deltaproteobacteria bacterium GWD2_55_8]|nr:MAG: single-stranded-DNA-specific exonuclease RecJ [Deltaproteobacteria bacterium GWD2_55_8]